MSENDDSVIPVFRAAKRRKVIARPRQTSLQPSSSSSPPPLPNAAEADIQPSDVVPATSDAELNGEWRKAEEEEEDEIEHDGLASALRARNALKKHHRPRKGGVSVSRNDAAGDSGREISTALIAVSQQQGTDAPETSSGVFGGRFARPTGVVADVMDKAMTAYIDSRILDLKADQARIDLESHDQSQQLQSQPIRATQPINKPREPVAAGKIQEIDLGPSAAQQNLLRTQAAAARLQKLQENGGAASSTTELLGRNGKKRKPRKGLGPDGKPWRARKPRRNSDDLKRDALVESLMSALPIDVFDTTAVKGGVAGVSASGAASGSADASAAAAGTGTGAAGAKAAGTEQDADERMLQEFQQRYVDAESSRRQRRPPPAKSKETDATKTGPRLGGSRSARAAMHKKREEEAKQKKH